MTSQSPKIFSLPPQNVSLESLESPQFHLQVGTARKTCRKLHHPWGRFTGAETFFFQQRSMGKQRASPLLPQRSRLDPTPRRLWLWQVQNGPKMSCAPTEGCRGRFHRRDLQVLDVGPGTKILQSPTYQQKDEIGQGLSDTVDGRNPANRNQLIWYIPALFAGFHTC